MKKLLFASLFFLAALIVNAALPKYLVAAPNPSKFELEAEEELQLFWQQLYGTKSFSEGIFQNTPTHLTCRYQFSESEICFYDLQIY